MEKQIKDKQNKFVRRTLIISAVLFAALVALTVFAVNTWPQRTLGRIDRLIENEKYEAAESLIEKYEAAEKAELGDEKQLCSYYIAAKALEEGDTEAARYRLKDLDGFMETDELLLECDYIDAGVLMDEGSYDEAYAIYAMLSDYKDSDLVMQEARYRIAGDSYDAGEKAAALEVYISLGKYEDSKEKADEIALEVTGAKNIDEAYKILEGMNLKEMQKISELTVARNALPEGVLAVGAKHTVGLAEDGTVLAAGLNDEGQCDISGWSGITAVDAGAYHTVGLKEDGTVVASGRNEEGQCDVESWKNVVKIAAGAYNTYGLLKNGTVVSTGFADGDSLATLKNIRYIGAGAYAAVCINDEGILFATHPSMLVSELGAAAADVNTAYIAALMPNGKVITTLENNPDWEDAIAISAGSNMLIALLSDGSAEAVVFDKRDEIDLSGYDNVIAAAAGGAHSAILLSDGSVVSFGSNEYGECDTEDWQLKIKR
ncbi:MAG: hypothetical protein JXN65_01720 [Clostridia bacterium]|nr:hypothetical protein [Clostridia bacterium]